jgi:hypothetical protein
VSSEVAIKKEAGLKGRDICEESTRLMYTSSLLLPFSEKGAGRDPLIYKRYS